MLGSKIYQIEINSEQHERKVIQKLVQLGFQKAVWEDEAKTSFVEVYVPSRVFSNYTNSMSKDNVITLEDFINLMGGGGETKTYNIEYKIGMFGCINIDVEMELPRNHPDFKKVLNEKANEIVKNEVLCYGAVDFIHTRD